MALFPGGLFAMGTPTAAIDDLLIRYQTQHRDLFTPETPQHPVRLGSFYLDCTPVTNARFKTFVDAQPQWRRDRIPAAYHNGEYLKHWHEDGHPPDKANHPVVYVCWYAAVAYAQWSGKRLPTEAEWEYAARGGSTDREYPWGNAPADPARANYGASNIGETTPVGVYAPTEDGLFDMAGNVWEYCADEWQADFYTHSPIDNPVSGGRLFDNQGFLHITTRRVIRGGSWGGAPVNLRVTYRDSHPPTGAGPHVGFRCARSA
jgi:formylglycine-generating enzyme required for sulfatase activity